MARAVRGGAPRRRGRGRYGPRSLEARDEALLRAKDDLAADVALAERRATDGVGLALDGVGAERQEGGDVLLDELAVRRDDDGAPSVLEALAGESRRASSDLPAAHSATRRGSRPSSSAARTRATGSACQSNSAPAGGFVSTVTAHPPQGKGRRDPRDGRALLQWDLVIEFGLQPSSIQTLALGLVR